MSEKLASQEIYEPTPEPDLFGLPRSWAGAVIGILLFTGILVILQLKESIFLGILLFPGHWVLGTVRLSDNIFGLSNSLYDVLTYSISYIFSCIPPAILGSLIISRNKVIRDFGSALLGIYLLILLGYGLFLYLLYSD